MTIGKNEVTVDTFLDLNIRTGGYLSSSQPLRHEHKHPASNLLLWPIPSAFRSKEEVVNRNLFARKLAEDSVEDAVKKYVYLDFEQMRTMWHIAKEISNVNLTGVGMELGAGCGLLSSIVAEAENIETILAVEICEEITSSLLPRVSEAVLASDAGKVVPVVGSFDDLQVHDSSIDFIVEIDSLHHSHDLNKTLQECGRVIKPGGYMICFDRCHPNHFSDQQVEEKLDRVYPTSFLEKNGYPIDKRLTRRQNGEHEYRLFEWQEAFEKAGFEIVKKQRVHKTIDYKLALKGLISLLPRFLRLKLIRDDSATPAFAWHWLIRKLGSTKTKVFDSFVGPKNSTVFVLRRRPN